MNHYELSFSIVTATYNAGHVLPRLINSLVEQTDQNFEWIVADGASTDNTMQLLEVAKQKIRKVTIDSRQDFGIYDALNRAVRLACGEYYLVLGADDVLFPNSVADYKAVCLKSRADFVTAKIEIQGRVFGPSKRPWEWLYSQFAYVSGHAVGLAINRALHQKYGYYSRRLPIAADRLFILKAVHGGSRVEKADFVAGQFDRGGTSGQDVLGSLTEGFRVQIAVGHSPFVQTILYFVRLFRHWSRIRRSDL